MNGIIIGVSLGQLITMALGFWDHDTLLRAAIYAVGVTVMAFIADLRHRQQMREVIGLARRALDVGPVR